VVKRTKPKPCKELTCEHARCAHGRPHCPVCPAPEAPKRASIGRCAACSNGVPVAGSNVCRTCSERGIGADDLFGGAA